VGGNVGENLGRNGIAAGKDQLEGGCPKKGLAFEEVNDGLDGALDNAALQPNNGAVLNEVRSQRTVCAGENKTTR
jgi:hypothetical protein